VPMHGWSGNLLDVERLAREKVVNEPGRVSARKAHRRAGAGRAVAARFGPF
jgi:hypothetical protein